MFLLSDSIKYIKKKNKTTPAAAMEPAAKTIADYLTSWGLTDYIDKFNEHAIDLETLQMLSEADIRDLVPIIGHRAKLMTQIKLLNKIMADAFQTTDTVTLDTLDSNMCIYTIDDILPADMQQLTSDNTADDCNPDPEPNSEQANSCNLYQTLSSCNEGKGLLLQYQEIGLLNNAARRRLCTIIIENELKDDPEKKITSSRFYQLAYEISKVFKQESSSVYFIPYASFSPLQKVSAKGKLLDYYRQRRRNFIKSGVIKIKEKRCSSSSSSYSNEPNSPRPLTFTQEAINQMDTECDVEEKMLWLENCCDPWQTVELYWELTTKSRLSLLTTQIISIAQYLSTYKALKLSGGIYLIQKDFNVMFPCSENKFNENWLLIRPKIIELAKKKALTTEIEENTEEGQDITALTALPFLMTTSNVTSTKKAIKKRQWRPSKQEVLEGFITHIQSSAEIASTITMKREKLKGMELQLQPFIVIVGPTKNSITERYVIINDTHYELHTTIKAVEACLKAIFVLNAEYPKECHHVWQFVQKAILKLKTKYDKSFTSVNTLMTDLGIKDE